MTPVEKGAITIAVIAVVLFVIWGAREVQKNSVRSFGGISTKSSNSAEEKQFSLDEIVSEIK